jgi:hypothetical protein
MGRRLDSHVFGDPEICEYEMSTGINQNVLRFDIPEDDVLFVKIIYNQQQFSKICFRSLFGEVAFLFDKFTQVSMGIIIENKSKLRHCLKRPSKRYNKRMIKLG